MQRSFLEQRMYKMHICKGHYVKPESTRFHALRFTPCMSAKIYFTVKHQMHCEKQHQTRDYRIIES